MNKINNLVRVIQETEKGSHDFEVAFSELFGIVYVETIEPKVRSFSRQLKGDIAEGESMGAELLLDLVYVWKDSGNFHSFYKRSLDNALINLIQFIGRDIRKHNTSYDVSLSDVVRVGSNTLMDDIIGSSEDNYMENEDGNIVEVLLLSFEKKKPTQSGIIEIMLTFSDDTSMTEKTQEYCKYYGVDEYCTTIQKRVSRARQAFKKHIEDNGYGGLI